ncbi:MAG: site-2 protease family protein [Clostridia bacterium]|nr:site-2 protease family protein [Clostridia bacterium]
MNLLSVQSVLSAIGSVALAILILLAMITVHEFGHYIAGKILKFKINEFAIGFGPKLFKRKSKKTGELFSVRLLPLGGFCAFEGEDGVNGEESANAFTKKAPWKRIIVLVAGPLMNYLLALLLIIVSMFAFGQPVYKVGSVAQVEPPEQAIYSEYSLEEGDLLLKVNGKRIYLITDMMSALKDKVTGDKISVTVSRGGEERVQEVILRADCNFESSEEVSKVWHALGLGTVVKDDGVKYWDVSAESYRFGFFETLGNSFMYSFKIAGTIFKVLGELLTGHIGLSSMGGPVTTIKLTSQLAVQSAQSFFEIAAYIGVNLAVFNLLPIPALDGSKVIFCLIEWIFRKPVPRKIEAVIHSVGFVLILAFAVIVDILQFAKC